jgi:hypothetical protein
MPNTRSQSRPAIPVTLPRARKVDTSSNEPPAKRTRSHTKSNEKPCTFHSYAPTTLAAISPEDHVAPGGTTSSTLLFDTQDESSLVRAYPWVWNYKHVPPGVVDISQGGLLSSTIGTPSIFCQLEPFQQGLLIHLHMTHYGLDYILFLRYQESRELRDLGEAQALLLSQRPPLPARTRTSHFDADEKSATSDDDSESIDVLDEEENDTSSDDGEVRSHNVSRYRPRNDVSTRLPYQPQLTVQMRRILVQWMSEVVQEFHLSEATYHLAVTLLDQLLARGPFGLENDRSSTAVPRCVCDDRIFFVQRNEFQALGWCVQYFVITLIGRLLSLKLSLFLAFLAPVYGWPPNWKIARLPTFAIWNIFPTIP